MCPHSEIFWSVFSRIRTEYGELRGIFRIQSEWGEIRTRKSPNKDFFYAVDLFLCEVFGICIAWLFQLCHLLIKKTYSTISGQFFHLF